MEMCGWVQKFQSRFRTNSVKRYFRLNNSKLSNHPQLTGPATWEISISKSIVRVNASKNLVIIRTPERVIKFQLDTPTEMQRWADAIQSGSVCNIEDFYKLGVQLGCGSYGAVKLAFDIITGEKRAVKVVERTSNAKELEFVQREVNVLLSISHPNIVRTYDIFDTRDQIYLVMDFVEGGDFFDYMMKKARLNEDVAKHAMWQMLQGIDYLHANNIVHRDIKPENILVTEVNPLTIQLTDFGFANFVDPTSCAPSTDMKSVVGTGCYMAPEIIDSRGHGKPVDIFASGVVMYRILSGKLPFRGLTIRECYKQAMMGRVQFIGKEWKEISDAGKTLCRRMLDADPEKRPSSADALGDAWFQCDGDFLSCAKKASERMEKKMAKRLSRIESFQRCGSRSLSERVYGENQRADSFTPRDVVSSPWR